MHGQKLGLPIDLYFGTQSPDKNATTSMKFVQQLHVRLSQAYKITQQIIERRTKSISETTIIK